MKSFKQHVEACWPNYKQVGMKKKGNKMVPNCVPEMKEEHPNCGTPDCCGECDTAVQESIPPEVVGAAMAAPVIAQGAKHVAKGAYKTVKGLMKAKKAAGKAGEKIAKRVAK